MSVEKCPFCGNKDLDRDDQGVAGCHECESYVDPDTGKWVKGDWAP